MTNEEYLKSLLASGEVVLRKDVEPALRFYANGSHIDSDAHLNLQDSGIVIESGKVARKALAKFTTKHATTSNTEDALAWNEAVNKIWKEIKPFVQKDMSFGSNQLALCDKILALSNNHATTGETECK